MRKAKNLMSVALLSALMMSSCQSTQVGTIKLMFDNNVSFVDASYNSKELKGPSGTKIENGLPEVKQDGYYFIGWREKDSNGNYRAISKLKDADSDNSYYYYPYGTDYLYPYFEKEVKITFDAGTNATMVKPAGNAEGYDNNYLNFKGYTNKTISSTNFLPTATKDHARFQYWYTTKKIVKVNNVEGGGYHYALDNASETGVYRFDTAFGTDNMKFLDNSFTLYASWEDDPYVTLNFGLDGIENYKFQAYDEKIGDKLKEGIKARLNVEYQDNGLFYKEKKLAGIYLDPEFTKLTSLDIKVSSYDLNLYMKWLEKANVTLDYNGGTFQGKSSEKLEGYYDTDTISKETLDTYVPVKENATFVGWELDGTTFVAGQTKIATTATLKAVYDDNPSLSVTYIYPLGYEGSLEGKTTHEYKLGDDISAFINDMKNTSLLSEGEHFVGVYQATNQTEESDLSQMNFVPVTSYLMPKDNARYYISIGVDEKVTLKDVTDGMVSENGKTKFFSNLDTVNLEAFEADPKADVGDKIFDGLFSDQACTKEIVSDRNGTTYALTDRARKYYSTGSTIYRKRTTGVKLTFKKVDGTEIGSAYFIPNKRVNESEVRQRMAEKFPSLTYTKFYEDAGCTKEITSIPQTAKTIYVK